MSTGKKIVDKARTRIGERYVFGSRVPMNNENWHGPWDCAEFCSWAIFQVSGILFGTRTNDYSGRNTGNPATADAYTGFWDSDSKEWGERISIEEAVRTPGAMLLRPPRQGRIGHIAISDGKGGTVEAKGSNYGVVEAKATGRGWTIGVLVPGVDYERNKKAVKYSSPSKLYKLTSPSTRGEEIEKLQRALTEFGYSPGPVDGIYGAKTEAAVIAFQIDRGLTVDGVVGKETLSELSPNNLNNTNVEDDENLNWTCSKGWRITGYFTPVEGEFAEVDMKKISVDNSKMEFPEKFINTVRMEGWGRTSDGWYLGFYGGKYHKSNEPKDSKGRELVYGAVAVDPRLIERGEKLKIDLPAVVGQTFTAKDVGGMITEKKVDIYCGEGRQAMLKTYAVTSNDVKVCKTG